MADVTQAAQGLRPQVWGCGGGQGEGLVVLATRGLSKGAWPSTAGA